MSFKLEGVIAGEGLELAAGDDAIRPPKPIGDDTEPSYILKRVPDVGEAVVGGREGNDGPKARGD